MTQHIAPRSAAVLLHRCMEWFVVCWTAWAMVMVVSMDVSIGFLV
jgi:hypothetical protein